jgi:hypothetical protein
MQGEIVAIKHNVVAGDTDRPRISIHPNAGHRNLYRVLGRRMLRPDRIIHPRDLAGGSRPVHAHQTWMLNRRKRASGTTVAVTLIRPLCRRCCNFSDDHVMASGEFNPGRNNY